MWKEELTYGVCCAGSLVGCGQPGDQIGLGQIEGSIHSLGGGVGDIGIVETVCLNCQRSGNDLVLVTYSLGPLVSGRGIQGADHFRGNDALTESRRRWLEHIFAEGRGRVAREAFWGGDGWYPRFNLGKFNYYWDSSTGKRVPVRNSGDNNWYQRFLDLSTPPADAATETAKIADISNGKVSDGVSAVDRLLKAHTVSGKYTDACLYDGQYEVLGLPFLRRIGNFGEKGGFEKVEDLRRQIAANLNDYCDTDSIPTSDVAADTWKDKVDKIDDLPKFTGNEQTPYINELAFGFKMSDGKITAETGKCDFEAKFRENICEPGIEKY